MRHLVLVLCAAALVAAVWLCLRPGDRDARVLDGPARAEAGPRASDELVGASAGAGTFDASLVGTDGTRTERSTVAAPAATLDRSEPPRAAVFGRFVDERGRPVADVPAVLSGEEPWRAGDDVPEDADEREWRTTSDDDGTFRFDVPFPTTSWVMLRIEPPPHFIATVDSIWWSDDPGEPYLVAGDNDLGDLVLEPAGELTGTVLDERGQPIPRAQVVLEGHARVTINLLCEPDGRYAMGNLPPGDVRLRAWGPGHAAEEEACEVAAGRTTRGPDFRLARAPTVSGVVVDERGAPVAGAALFAWPSGDGRAAEGVTDAAGRFALALPQPEACYLQVTHGDAFEPWGGLGVEEALFEPGRSDVRVVLRSVEQVTFVVRDALTREPVERFLIFGEGSWNPPHRPAEHHAGGVARLAASSARMDVGVRAPGYAPLEVAVDASASALGQELLLRRGGTLVGRVLTAGEPAAGARAELAADALPKDPLLAADPHDPRTFGNVTRDVGGLGLPREVDGDAQGAFRFEHLAPGTYRLEVRVAGRAPARLRGLVVADGATLDVGAIETQPGATLRGRVVLPEGRSPSGLELYLDEYDRSRLLHDRAGTFVFEELAPGRHELLLHAQSVLAADVRLAVDLEPGETREVVIDVAERAPCEVIADVRWPDGSAAVGVRLFAQREEAGRFDYEPFDPLDVTDADGRAVGLVASGGRVRLVACSDGRFALGHGEPFAPAAGGVHTEVLTAAAGELVLVFPDGDALAAAHAFELRLARDGDEDDVGWTRWETPAAAGPGTKGRWTGPRCTIDAVGPGRYALRLTVLGGTRWSSGSETWTRLEPLFPPLEASIEIRAGETTVLEVPLP